MTGASGSSSNDKVLVLIIAGGLACYLVAAAFHLPQHGTELVVASRSHRQAGHQGRTGNAMPPAPPEAFQSHPPYWMVTPFAALLAAIAVLPLVPAATHWWENNLHRSTWPVAWRRSRWRITSTSAEPAKCWTTRF